MNRSEGKLRIGTWNLDNRIPTDKHFAILRDHACDVWLLTELNPRRCRSEKGLGDWNHSRLGKEHAGSMGGRKDVLAAIETLGLKVPTSTLSHRGDYCTAIDHIGVPMSWAVDGVYRIDAEDLSDHDAYVVDVAPAKGTVHLANQDPSKNLCRCSWSLITPIGYLESNLAITH